jgi:hypothetical protein
MPSKNSTNHGVHPKHGDRASAPRVRSRSKPGRDRPEKQRNQKRGIEEQLRDRFFQGGPPADVIVVFALRASPSDGKTDVVREIMPMSSASVDYKGGNVFDLTKDQRDAIVWMLQSGEGPGVLEEVEKLADIGNRIGPKVMSIIDLIRKKGQQPQ